MNIIAYQLEDDTCRFIYNVSGTFRTVSVMNYGGMASFLSHSGATKLSIDVDIHQYAADMIEIGHLAFNSNLLNGDMANEFNESFHSDML